MAQSLEGFTQDPLYEQFLGASVGEDSRGFNVSVLSMLARLDLDPWEEAADLASLADGPVRQRLEALLAQFSDVPLAGATRAETVTRLLSFLPARKRGAAGPAQGGGTNIPMPAMGLQLFWIVVTVLALGYFGAMAQGG